MKLLQRIGFGLGFVFLFESSVLALNLNQIGRQPTQNEPASGLTVGMAGGGLAAVDGVHAVEANPAMIAQKKQYRLAGDYFLPAYGRPFYKANLVDAQTNKVAAGVSYLASQESFVSEKTISPLDNDNYQSARYDGRIEKRFTLSLAKNFKTFSLGIQGVHTEGYEKLPGFALPEKSKTTKFGFGFASLLTKQMRLAIAVRGVGSAKGDSLDPPLRQIGLAYLLANSGASLHVDVRQRKRTPQEFLALEQPDFFAVSSEPILSDTELSAIASGVMRFDPSFQMFAGYGVEIGGAARKSAGIGASLESQGWSASYSYLVPYLGEEKITQTISLSFLMKV